MLAVALAAVALFAPPGAAPSDAPTDARASLLAEFARHPLVAFGEEHHNDRQHAFLRSLVADPAFAGTVDDVVVEFGNARYQRLVDRWLLNRRPGVALARVRRAWLDTTQRSTWAGPLYERFFRAVRAANMRVPPARRVRVLLGDPPIDWSKIRTNVQYERWIARRNTHYASVVERLVLARGRRALLIAGSSHLLRSPVHERNETGLLEVRHAGSVFVVLPETAVLPGHRDVEQQLRSLPAPSLAPLAGTPFGAAPAAAFLGDDWGDGTLADRADAFLVLGGP